MVETFWLHYFYSSSTVAEPWPVCSLKQACLVAIIVPDPDFLPDWASKKGFKGSYEELCRNKAMKHLAHQCHMLCQISDIQLKKLHFTKNYKYSLLNKSSLLRITFFFFFLLRELNVWTFAVRPDWEWKSEKNYFLFKLQAVKDAILEEIVKLGKEGGLKSFEQVGISLKSFRISFLGLNLEKHADFGRKKTILRLPSNFSSNMDCLWEYCY